MAMVPVAKQREPCKYMLEGHLLDAFGEEGFSRIHFDSLGNFLREEEY